MITKIKQIGKKLLSGLSHSNDNIEYLSYAQAGEDKVVEFLFLSMGLPKITYLEIGTNDPIHYNNTYLFYRKGSRGICVEPNPTLISNIIKQRPEDVCLNVGVARKRSDALEFYVFDDKDKAKGLSTFSKEEANYIESTTPIKVAKVEKIPVITIQEILKSYFPAKAPDFISIDVEGLDLDILQSLNFDVCRPVALCVETVSFSINHKRPKRDDIIEFMLSKNYCVYANTGINSIFVDKSHF